jgi:hypothetical protein
VSAGRLAGGATAIVTGLLMAGCASAPTGQKLQADGQAALDAAPLCCADRGLAAAQRGALPLAPTSVEIDGHAQAHDFGGNKAFFVLYELPAYREPYAIKVTSRPKGGLADVAILVPRVAMYDADFKLTRYFDDKTLRNRGNDLERTVFINPDDARERYIAIHGSNLSASIERAYSLVTVTPVMAGPVMFNMYGGQDGKSVLRSAPTGTVQIEVQGPAAVVTAKP